MSCHFIEQFTKPDEKISIYKTGKFLDFCRGLLPSTGKIKAFKLLNILPGRIGWGMRRIRSFSEFMGPRFSKKDLDAYLNSIEEAKKRDHRVLGQAAGSIFHSGTGRAGADEMGHRGAGSFAKKWNIWMRETVRKAWIFVVTTYTPHVMRKQLCASAARGFLRAEHVDADGTG